MKVVINHIESFEDLGTFGVNDSNFDNDLISARRLTALLYDQSSKYPEFHDDLNRLRFKIGVNKDVSLCPLPPCEASFRQHALRAAFQTKIWLNSHIPEPDLGSPKDFGREVDNNILTPVLFEGPTASELLEGLVCNCKDKKLCSRSCSCCQARM